MAQVFNDSYVMQRGGSLRPGGIPLIAQAPRSILGTHGRAATWMTGGNRLILPLSNSIASNNIPLSFENCEPASSASDTTYCGTNAPHRNAYPGLEWDYFVGVHGGRPPYYLELLQAPTGMTVMEPNLVLSGGVYYWHPNHMRLQWQNPTPGTHTVEVQVTDQDGTQITSSWPLVSGILGHAFLNPVSGSDAGNGLIGSPYQTLAPLISGHGGHICHIYGGTVEVHGANWTVNSSVPTGYVAMPGETVNISQLDGWFVPNNASDIYFKDLTIFHEADGWSAAVDDRRCFRQINGGDRANLHDLKFTHYVVGPETGDNPAVFMSEGAINNRQVLYNWDVTGETGTVIQSFMHRGAIYRKIRIHDATLTNPSGSSNGGAIKCKDGWSNLSIDFNEMWENNTFTSVQSCVDLAGQDQGGLGISNTDVRYNKLWYTGNANQGGAVRIYTNNNAPNITNTHLYRNSLKGTNSGDAWWNNAPLNPTTPNTHENENNVLENGNCPVDTCFLNTNNAEGSTTRFDDFMNLAAGTQRDTLLGTHSAEIAA